MKNKAVFNLLMLVGTMFILVVLFINVLNVKKAVDLRSRAEENFSCQASCSGFNRCDLNNPNSPPPGVDPNYNDPCCEEIAKTGDPFACGDWVKRGYCTVDQCNAILEGTPRQKCGGPRWHWCDLCKQNNCPGYGGQPATTPTSAQIQPTPTLPVIPTPTVKITVAPTPEEIIPTASVPTRSIEFPTSIPETNFPSPTLIPTPAQFRIQLPQININLIAINQSVRKPLGFLKYLFETVVEYDQKMEKSINGYFGSFFK